VRRTVALPGPSRALTHGQRRAWSYTKGKTAEATPKIGCPEGWRCYRRTARGRVLTSCLEINNMCLLERSSPPGGVGRLMLRGWKSRGACDLRPGWNVRSAVD
jgi:hypothetical protein